MSGSCTDGNHSPAPWHVDEDYRPRMEWNRHIYSADNLAVCFMAHSDGNDVARDEANARLISAAPRLLANLEFAVKLLKPIMAFGNTAQVEAMEAAIKEARGG